jgi:hypothetical protein
MTVFWIDPTPLPKAAGVINAPLCHWHRYYWLRRGLILYGGYVLLFVALVLIAFPRLTEPYNRHVLFGSCCFLLIWLPWAVFVWLTGIRVKAMDQRTLVLGGVSSEFAVAVQEQAVGDSDSVPANSSLIDENNPFTGLTS